MPSIDDLRKKYPGSAYETMTPLEIVDYVSKSTGRALDAVAYDYGVPLPNESGFGTAAKNSMYSMAQGAGQLAGDFIPGVDPNNSLEMYGREGVQRNPVDIFDGEGSALRNLGSNLVERPGNTLGQIAGQSLGLIAPGGAAKTALGAYRGLRGLGAMGTAGRGAMGAADTVMYGLPSYGSMRDSQEELGQNTTLDKLKALGSAAAIGQIEKGFGLESALAGRGVTGGTLRGTIARQALGEAGEEMAQAPFEQFGSGKDVFTQETLDQMLAGGAVGALGGAMAGPIVQMTSKKPLSDTDPTNLFDPDFQPAYYQGNPDADTRRALVSRAGETYDLFQDGTTPVNQPFDLEPSDGGTFVNPNQAELDLQPQATFGDGASLGLPFPQQYNLVNEAEPVDIKAAVDGLVTPKARTDVKGITAAVNEPSGVRVSDPETGIERELTMGEWMDLQAGGLKEQQQAAVTQQKNAAAVVELYNNIAGTNNKTLPQNKLAVMTEVNDLVSSGQVEPEDVANIVGRLQKSRYPEAQKALDELKKSLAARTALAETPTQELSPADAKVMLGQKVSQAIAEAITPDQARWWAARSDTANENKSDAELASELGYSRQNAFKLAKNSRAAVVKSAAVRYGISPEQAEESIVAYLQSTKPKAEAAENMAGMSPAQQQVRLDERSLMDSGEDSDAGGLTVINSAGGSSSAVGTSEEVADTPDPVYDARVAEAKAKRDAFNQQILSHPYAGLAAEDWDDMRSSGAPSAAELPEQLAVDWIYTYIEFKEGVITNEQLEREQRDLEDEADGYSQRNPGSPERVNGTGSAAISSGTENATESQPTPAPAREESPSLRQPAEVISALEARRSNPIARDYLARVRNGEDVEKEANAWLDATEADQKDLKAKGTKLPNFGRGYADIREALATFEDAGLSAVFGNISTVEDADLGEGTNGLFVAQPDGKFKVQLNRKALEKRTKADAAHTVRHEVSHGVDYSVGWALSQHPELQFTVEVDGSVTPVGDTAKEIYDHYLDGGVMAEYLGYPLDRETNASMPSFDTQAELFAQLSSVWLTPAGKQFVTKTLPKTAAFMKEAFNYASKTIRSGSGSRRSQETTGQAETVSANEGIQSKAGQTLNTKFQQWFGGSKVVDENGAPLVVYHGTNADFSEFSKDKLGSATGAQSAKEGFFFAGNSKVASSYSEYSNPYDKGISSIRGYERLNEWLLKKLGMKSAIVSGGNVMPVYLSIKNPLVVDYNGQSYNETAYTTALTRAKANGNDGVILKNTVDEGFVEGQGGDTATDIYVVFEPTQIKSASGNTGNFDPKNPNILASKGGAFEVRPEINSWMNDFMYKIKDLTPKWLTGTQLVEQWGDRIKTLVTHQNVLDKTAAEETRLRKAGHKLLESWGTYAFRNAIDNERLMDVMSKATQWGIHADLPFDHELNKHLAAGDRAKYTQLAGLYNGLDKQAKSIYKDAKQVLADTWTARKQIWNDLVDDSYGKRIKEAEATGDAKLVASLKAKQEKEINDYDKAFKELKGPYFPQMRFGDNILVAESKEIKTLRDQLETAEGKARTELEDKLAKMEADEKHYIVQAFEKRTELEAEAAKLKAKGYETRGKKAEAYSREFRPVTANAEARINEMVNAQFDGPTATKMKAIITEMYLSSTPERHALQRQIKRKGVAGASTDMLRAFAESVERDSHYLARLKYNRELTSNLYVMQKETSGKGIDESNIYNTVLARTEADMDYRPTPVISMLARASSMFHLGVSPAYLLTNMTQPWFITLPQLSGKFGVAQSTGAMKKAWGDAAAIIKQAKGGDLMNLADIDLSKVKNADERKLLEYLRDRNKLDADILLDMANLADGIDPRLMKAQKAFGWATHHIELVNRISTALATYRLEKSKNPKLTSDQLIESAMNMVDLTQLDYSAQNTALLMKPTAGLGAINKLVFQFRKYQQGMLYLLGRNAKLAWGGDKDAMRSLTYLMGMQVAFAGMAGVPLTAPVLAALNLLLDDDDEDGDAETQMRNHLADMLGEDAARAFYKGLPAAFGLDVSGNVGMGGLLKPFPMMSGRDVTDARNGKELVSEVLLNAAGAPVGMVADVLDGAKLAWEGEFYKGLARMSPRFVGSMIKAAELADDGLTTRTGKEVMAADQFDGWDVTFRALGFNPTAVSEHYSAQMAKDDTATEIRDLRTNLLQKYTKALNGGEDIADVMEDIQEFNLKHPGNMINRSVMLKARARGKSAETDEAGVSFNKQEQSLKPIDRFAK